MIPARPDPAPSGPLETAEPAQPADREPRGGNSVAVRGEKASVPVPVTVVILTLNEEVNLPDALASCAGWCDDVHVVDSGSTDATVALATEALGAENVHHHGFESFGKQRNWAIEHVPAKHDWIFHLDADERFTPALVEELHQRLAVSPREAEALDAFRCPHKMMMHGTWLRRSEGYPVYQVRLFHRARMRFVDHGHGQREDPAAKLGTLVEPYLHEAYRRGIDDWVARHNVHSRKEAQALLALEREGGAPGLLGCLSTDRTRRRRALKHWSWKLPGRPWLRWFSILFLQRGFLDGPAAWRYAELMRLYDQMTGAKVRWMRQQAAVSGPCEPDDRHDDFRKPD